MSVSKDKPELSDIQTALRTKYAVFTGGYDKNFRPTVIFQDVSIESVTEECFSLLFAYFSTLFHPRTSCEFVAVIDRRTGDWNSVKRIVSRLNVPFPADLMHIYVIKPHGLLQRLFVERTMTWIRDNSKHPVSFVDTTEELLPFIDSMHLPTELGGQLSFDIEQWIQDRLKFESFKSKVDELCDPQRNILKTILGDENSSNESHVLPNVNAIYLSPLLDGVKDKRDQWLAEISACEDEGLRLRQELRKTSEFTPPPTPSDTDSLNGNASWVNRSNAFDLPIDRIFHIIHLEHTLVQLTEARSRFDRWWKCFKRRSTIARLLFETEMRFDQLHPLLGLWENLVESTADYRLPISTDSNGSSEVKNASVYSASESASESDFKETDVSRDSLTVSDNSSSDNNATNLDALLGRLCEASEYGNQLLPELRALYQITTWLIPTVLSGDVDFNWKDSVDLQCIWDAFLPYSVGLEDLDCFSISTESPFAKSASTLYSCENGCSDPFIALPNVQLPTGASEWKGLFDRLIQLAEDDLNKSFTHINLLALLFAEMQKAEEWIRTGRELLTRYRSSSTTPIDATASRTLSEELNTFRNSRQTTLFLLSDPKELHCKLTSLPDQIYKPALMQLLKAVELVEGECNAAYASLQQLISRTSFPRCSSTNAANGSQMESIPPPLSTTLSSRNSLPTQRTKLSDNLPDRLSSSARLALKHHSSKSIESESFDATLPHSTTPKRYQLAWEELVETERAHVRFLQHVFDVMWVGTTDEQELHMGQPVSQFLRDNITCLLSNWSELLCFHRDVLLPALELCNAEGTRLNQWATEMGPRLIDLNVVYCQHHSKAEYLASSLERDNNLASWINSCNAEVHRREVMNSPTMDNEPPTLPFSSRLVTPIQRFQRYQIFLDRLKSLAPSDIDRTNLKEACDSIRTTCETINLIMRFHGLKLRPSELGHLLLEGTFAVSRSDQRSFIQKQHNVFLFNNGLLITRFRPSAPNPGGSSSPMLQRSTESRSSSEGRGSNSVVGLLYQRFGINISNLPMDSGPVYSVEHEFVLTEIGLTPNLPTDRRRFAIWTAKRAQTYYFQCSDSTVREKWVHTINELLMSQLRAYRANSSGLYCAEPKKIISRSSRRPNRRIRSEQNKN